MAISLADQQTLIEDKNFTNRVRQACITVSMEVLTETELNYEKYTARVTLANRFITSPQRNAELMAIIFATDSPTADHTAITDAQLIGYVIDNWDTLSGYNPNAPAAPE